MDFNFCRLPLGRSTVYIAPTQTCTAGRRSFFRIIIHEFRKLLIGTSRLLNGRRKERQTFCRSARSDCTRYFKIKVERINAVIVYKIFTCPYITLHYNITKLEIRLLTFILYSFEFQSVTLNLIV